MRISRRIKKLAVRLFLSAMAASLLTGCGSSESSDKNEVAAPETEAEIVMKLCINNTEIPVVWEENKTAAALMELVSDQPLTVEMSMYGGFEQVGSLGHVLPDSDKHITTENGDIVLYNGGSIVIFYGSNSWSYTRLGKIDLSEKEVTDMLSNGAVTITITK